MSNKTKEYLNTLNEVFETGAPSQDQVLGLMDETMSFFEEIKAKLESNDPAVQKAAFEETMEMKRILESKMQALAEKSGLSLSDLAALAGDANRMSSEEQKTLDAAKAKLAGLKESDHPVKKHTINPQKIIG